MHPQYALHWCLASKPGERRAFVYCHVIRFVALDLVLRLILACMNLVPFELNLRRYCVFTRAADVLGLRIPTNVIADYKVLTRHCLYSDSSCRFPGYRERNLRAATPLPINVVERRKNGLSGLRIP